MNPSLSEEECRARMIGVCTMCKNANIGHEPWDQYGITVPDELHDTANCAKGAFYDWHDNTCCSEASCGMMQSDCRALGVE